MKPESPFYESCLTALKQSPLFSHLDDQTLGAILEISRRETWTKGSHLPPSQTTERFTIVISGRLELTRANPETGRQITLFLMQPGDAFDVITLLDGKEHDIDPIAVGSLEVITAPLPAIRQWVERNPSFNSAFLPYLGKRIRDLENLSADLALSETITRLANLILQQASPGVPPLGEKANGPPLINTLSDEAMGRMIGSVRAVVNRHLQEFKQLGLISTSHGKLLVTDLEKLREYCERIT